MITSAVDPLPATDWRHLRLMLMALNPSAAVAIHGSLHAPGMVNFLKQRTVFHFAGRRLRPRSVDVLATNGCLFRAGDLRFDVRHWLAINMVDLNVSLESPWLGGPSGGLPCIR
ncbi:hypothetical protein [Cyanobium sp. N5-Cardenillas]|uniref:hypothetical protein n=1 Tax=Cyanobium sp. N5-Cardenillas TaxID=2823720 RepID=UPI0020CDCE1A|nr:hypothetical protein [Cyanobium sp. N5-Cardenillas]MCP9785201.1 hypothetical protein [Cyanobium sp. N5-Cardenillas]